MERCRCCFTDMENSDHCPRCFCEQFEEREDCTERQTGEEFNAS